MATEKVVYIRNLNPHPMNLRLGSKGSPYYVDFSFPEQISRRGQQGDVVQVPANLVNHPSFTRNLGKLFEIISKDEAEALESTQLFGEYSDVEFLDYKDENERAEHVVRVHTLAAIDERAQIDNAQTGKHNKFLRNNSGLLRLRNEKSPTENPDRGLGPEQVHGSGPKSIARRGR